MNRNIILIRFDSLSGKTASFLTRMLISKFYRIILETKTEQQGDKAFHAIFAGIREFEDVLEKQDAYKSYVAMAREAGTCLILASQFEASISSKIGNQLSGESFMGHVLL